MWVLLFKRGATALLQREIRMRHLAMRTDRCCRLWTWNRFLFGGSFSHFLERILAKSLYETDCQVEHTDQLLTRSPCSSKLEDMKWIECKCNIFVGVGKHCIMKEVIVYERSALMKILAAVLAPGLLVVLFSRVTYSYVVGLLLTVALIAASAYRGFTSSWPLIIVDAFSLTAGFWYSKRMIERSRAANSAWIMVRVFPFGRLFSCLIGHKWRMMDTLLYECECLFAF